MKMKATELFHLCKNLRDYFSLSFQSFIKLFSKRSKNSDIGFGQSGVPKDDRTIIDVDDLPWLLLPHDSQCESLKFYDLSRNKVHELELPEILLGGVCVEAWKGWLVIAKEGQYIRDTKYSSYLSFKPIPDAEIFLFNPLSRGLHQLPSLSTLVPYYYSFVNNCIFNLGEYNVADFIFRIELSSADPSKSIIALMFNEFEAINSTVLALCRLGDNCWTIFPRELYGDIAFADMLFYNGDLCLLSHKIEHVETHMFKMAEDDVVRIKFIPDMTAHHIPLMEMEYMRYDIAIIKHNVYEPYLVESINGELLIIIAHIVCYAYDDEDDYVSEDNTEEEDFDYDDEDDDEDNIEWDGFHRFYYKVSGFSVFEVDPNTGMILRSVQSLSDQIIFLTSKGRSVSVPAENLPCGIQGNCIFFLESSNDWSSLFDAYQTGKKEALLPRVARESGICYLENGRIERVFPSFNRPLKCKVGWFSPIL